MHLRITYSKENMNLFSREIKKPNQNPDYISLKQNRAPNSICQSKSQHNEFSNKVCIAENIDSQPRENFKVYFLKGINALA